MKFLDMVNINVKAGNGGNGCVSLRRESHVPRGGPDGGNGGRGGSVWIAADYNLQTLADYEYSRRYSAPCGEHGSGSGCNGKSGKDITLRVPCGTIIYDADTGEGIADLVEQDDRLLIARGGRGGRGNRAFTSSARRVPNFAEKGSGGEDLNLRLELKLIADFGFVGCPNVGKSSLLAALSNARPKIAAYPFTTLSPNLGVLTSQNERLVLADIPGLIEGASQNRGLGLEFLRHVQRARLLIHVLDMSSADVDTIMDEWNVVRREMLTHDPDLGARPCIVLGNKSDYLEGDTETPERLRGEFGRMGYKFFVTSALTNDGITELVHELIDFGAKHPRPVGEARLYAISEKRPDAPRSSMVQIVRQTRGAYRVIHYHLEEAAERYNFEHEENIPRYGRLLRKYRVEELLVAAGAQAGDTVHIGPMSFDFTPDFEADSINDESADE